MIWTVQGGMNSRGSGNDRVEMRRANSSFRRKAECRRWETRMPRLCETGSTANFPLDCLDLNGLQPSMRYVATREWKRVIAN